MDVLNEIKKGKMILSGMSKEKKDKRNNFFKDLSSITFYSEWFNTWEGFQNHILKNCQNLEKVCKKYRSNSKSASTPYLDDIAEKSVDLYELITYYKKIELIPNLVLSVYNDGFKMLSDSCYNIYKAKFTTSFGAVLDHSPTKDIFLLLRNDLIGARKKFNYFYILESIKYIISLANKLVQSRKFDTDINEKIYIPDSNFEKYTSFKISTNFARYDSDRSKVGNLKQLLTSIREKLKNYRYINAMLGKFIYEKLNQKFIDSLQAGKAEECVICKDEMDISDVNDVVTIKCGHTFHKDCFEELKGHTDLCPLCRQKF